MRTKSRSKMGPKTASTARYLKRKATRGLKATQRKAVRAIAKEVIRKEAEDKFVSTNGTTSFNQTISGPGECYPLMPRVPQGVDDYQRVGDKVRPKYLIVRGTVQYDISSLAGTDWMPPNTARVMILEQKNVPYTGNVSSQVDTAHLLKDNNGTGVGRPYAGGPYDNLAPINTDTFKVYMDRKIKFNWFTRPINESSVPFVQGNVGNDRAKSFYCKIKLPSTLTFDPAGGNWPIKPAPFICMGGVNDDFDSAFSLSTTPYRMTWVSTLYYEDA